MSKQVNRIAIGGFVVGAIGLVVLAILVLGSGEFFQHKIKQVLFFQGSVKGLNVGSPVKFRGVDIGEVVKIELTINPDNLELFVPVYVEIFRNKISIMGGAQKTEPGKDNGVMNDLVNKMGLRAQLQMQSLLTGQLFINYDFYPDTPISRTGLEEKVYEVPTIPTTLQMLTDSLQQIVDDLRRANLKEIVANIAQTAEGANKLFNSSDMRESVANLNVALQDVQRFIKKGEALVVKIDGRVDPVADSLVSTMDDTRKLVHDIDSQVGPIAGDIQNAMAEIQATFSRAEIVLVDVQKMISENSELRREIMTTLENLSNAAQSVDILAEYLQQHPESLIKGKK